MNVKTTLGSLACMATLLAGTHVIAQTNPGTPTRAYLFDEGGVSTLAFPVGAGVPGIISGHNWAGAGLGVPVTGAAANNNALDATGTGGGPVSFIEDYGPSGIGGTEFSYSVWLNLNNVAANQDETFLSSASGGTYMKTKKIQFDETNPATWIAGRILQYNGGNTSINAQANPPGFAFGATAAYTGWHHYTWTWKDGNGDAAIDHHMYWDGVQFSDDGFSDQDSPVLDFLNGVVLGQNGTGTGSTENWVGGLDEFGYFDRQLTGDEILWLSQNSLALAGGTAVPEPATLTLLGLGILGTVVVIRRPRRRRE